MDIQELRLEALRLALETERYTSNLATTVADSDQVVKTAIKYAGFLNVGALVDPPVVTAAVVDDPSWTGTAVSEDH